MSSLSSAGRPAESGGITDPAELFAVGTRISGRSAQSVVVGGVPGVRLGVPRSGWEAG